MNKIQDMHIHVRYALENPNEFDNIINYGISLGITEFVFLEHGFRISEKRKPILINDKIAKILIENVDRLNNIYPAIKVWSGIEIDYSENSDFRNKTIKYLNNTNFDVVIGAIHSMKLNSEEYYKAIIDMIINYPINIIAHMKMYDDYKEQELIQQIMYYCKAKNIKFEINTSDRSIWDEEQLNYMISLMQIYGVNYTIGSDAHCIEEVGKNYDKLDWIFMNKGKKNK